MAAQTATATTFSGDPFPNRAILTTRAYLLYPDGFRPRGWKKGLARKALMIQSGCNARLGRPGSSIPGPQPGYCFHRMESPIDSLKTELADVAQV